MTQEALKADGPDVDCVNFGRHALEKRPHNHGDDWLAEPRW